jgi:hypothetical protein
MCISACIEEETKKIRSCRKNTAESSVRDLLNSLPLKTRVSGKRSQSAAITSKIVVTFVGQLMLIVRPESFKQILMPQRREDQEQTNQRLILESTKSTSERKKIIRTAKFAKVTNPLFSGACCQACESTHNYIKRKI